MPRFTSPLVAARRSMTALAALGLLAALLTCASHARAQGAADETSDLNPLIGRVARRNVYAEEILARCLPELRELAAGEAQMSEFLRASRPVVFAALRERIDERLVVAQAEAGLSEEGDARLRAYEEAMRLRLIEQNGDMVEEADRRLREKTGYGLDETVRRFREQSLIRGIINEKFAKQLEVRPEELSAYYDAHHEEFILPSQPLVRRIRIADPDDADRIDRLLEGGATFAIIAGSHENLLQARDRAVVGSSLPGPWGEAFAAMEADGLEDGERSPRIDLGDEGFGWIEFARMSDEKLRTFEQSKGKIQGIIRQQHFQTVMREYAKELEVSGQVTDPEFMTDRVLDVALKILYGQ